MKKSLMKVVIAGGGTAGWVAAAALSSKFDQLLDITLVESEQIATVGVGEATIPTAQSFNRLIGINEQEFMRATNATFKLGIAFEDWGQIGDSYIHSFGEIGQSSWLAEFHQFWLYAKSLGIDTDIGLYSLEAQAGLAYKFQLTQERLLNYAYHLDSSRYAKFLRSKAEARGVNRVEGIIQEVKQCSQTGNISSLALDNGSEVEGDLFIDCTGFRALLIEGALQTGFEDWSEYLPSDRAVVVQTETVGDPIPLTKSIAHTAGWRWQIPLQNRIGNGLVFSNEFMTEDQAFAGLQGAIAGKPLTEPRLIKYKSGRRKQVWNKNCVALGLTTGFVEPLESTTIHLLMTGITRLMEQFPFNGISEANRNKYNRLCREELVDIRDFIVLHYHVTQRTDSEFWNHCRNMSIPSTLEHRISLFQEQAHAFQGGEDLFRVDSWVQVMIGQGLMPQAYHPMVKNMPEQELRHFFANIRKGIKTNVDKLSTHKQFIEAYCKAT